MTDAIRKSIHAAIEQSDLSQAQVARSAALRPDYVNAMLSGRRMGSVDTWLKLLTALDLELVLKPKPKHPAPSSGVTEEEDA